MKNAITTCTGWCAALLCAVVPTVWPTISFADQYKCKHRGKGKLHLNIIMETDWTSWIHSKSLGYPYGSTECFEKHCTAPLRENNQNNSKPSYHYYSPLMHSISDYKKAWYVVPGGHHKVSRCLSIFVSFTHIPQASRIVPGWHIVGFWYVLNE